MTAAPVLDHDDLQRWRACERRFWLQRHGPLAGSDGFAASDAIGETDAEVASADAVVDGPAPGAALRATFPRAVTIAAPRTPAEWDEAAQQTANALAARLAGRAAAREDWALFGACLAAADGTRVRIDVVAQGERGLRIFKLRLATAASEADVDVALLWAHVAARCGLPLESAGLLLVDTGFVYPGHGCYAGLFREVDLGPMLGSRPIASWLAAMRACDREPAPQAQPGPQCSRLGGCPFIDGCRADDPRAGAAAIAAMAAVGARGCARLEIVGRELAAELRREGHSDLLDVPLERFADPRHQRAVRAIQQGRAVLEPGVAELMRAQPYPRHLLRFDTVGFAVPVWAGTQPYQVLPFQWSCDVQAAPGDGAALLRHGFLADASRDPRREFASTLLQVLGTEGAVFAYNAGFERNRIRDLARLFDDLRPALEAILPRMVDLFQIARANLYHPAMCGSWSFRSVFGAIAPELHAGQFDAGGLTSAQAAFAQSLRRGLDRERVESLRAALRAHGRRQTEALRRMVALFENGGEGAGPGVPPAR